MVCEIYYVAHKKSFRWKWRVQEDGRVKESKDEYLLYYECVSDARRNGYEPRVKCR